MLILHWSTCLRLQWFLLVTGSLQLVLPTIGTITHTNDVHTNTNLIQKL